MSKTITSISLLLVSVGLLLAIGQLTSADPTQVDHYLLHEACSGVLNQQISWELYASVVYLNMAGYFDRPTVARPGFSKFFKDQSQEEYNHASMMIDYLNKRNATVQRIAIEESPKSVWSDPKEAISDAITLEKHVFAKIRHIHDVADQKCQDPHLTDFLENNFLTEQVDSIHELQTMLTTLTVTDSTAAIIIEMTEDAKLRKEL